MPFLRSLNTCKCAITNLDYGSRQVLSLWVTITNGDFLIEWTLSALTSQTKNGGISVGSYEKFVWVTMGKFLSHHILAKEEDIEH